TTTGAAEHLDNLLEEFVARIEGLSPGIAGIISVLADEQDASDGQLSGPPGQGLGDRGVDRQARMARGALQAQITPRLLVHVERDDVHRRLVMPALPAVAVEEAVDDSLTVRCLEFPLPLLGNTLRASDDARYTTQHFQSNHFRFPIPISWTGWRE